ncbi:TonB-dependent receptor [Stigmatella aurantiaca]|uniref:Oar protein n=1 Tax=Stigmatella aurantiaca (strain DW4/3-1) TaxID=378806 RepID=Q095P1_STIAD|nr:TonB-dependent receptor [Stigmatella aurantiaca]ADO68347.1 Oar protein [Stigmatella aurantiaca DW4/3-1]EAU67435.1 protein oar [Stigmatella aurantiaca DW4/3-1]
MIKRRNIQLSRFVALVMCFAGNVALAQGTSVLLGKIVDSATGAPLADAVITATSPNLQGEQVVLSDASGEYRIPQLPPGLYTLRFERDAFQPFVRDGIALRLDSSLRVNVELLPDGFVEEIAVVARAPTVDVGSASTGININESFIRNIAVVVPGGKGAAARSFEALAELAPGAHADTYGVSISGATSPENQYVLDGVSVNDPGFGINGSQLSVEFIREVNVISGGYLPEYGRATGGVLNAVTKSGSNEFHGSVFGNLSPGSLASSGREIQRTAGTVSGRSRLWNQGDFGADLGGPILKDKLWFYLGMAPSFSRFRLERNLDSIELGADGQPLRDEDGLVRTQRIPGSQRFFFADNRAFQYIGKLTYLVDSNHNLTVSVSGTPSTAGGPGRFSVSDRTGMSETDLINGLPESIATQKVNSSTDASLKWSSSFWDKRLLVDATLGWHHQEVSTRASDGTRAGSLEGLAGTPYVYWQRSPAHSVLEFESVADPSACGGTAEEARTRCPVQAYSTGGPARLSEADMDRFQGKLMGTLLLKAAGEHIVKAGMDMDRSGFDHVRAHGGGSMISESEDGTYFQDFHQYGYLLGPDQVQVLDSLHSVSHSTTVGAFVQDSWNVLDLVTVNVGLRYDTQTLEGNGKVGLILANQWSPRLGLIVDPTREGRSKLFVNYARYYEAVPLDLVDRSLSGEPQVRSHMDSSLCNPLEPGQLQGVCDTDAARLPFRDPLDPSRRWQTVGSGFTLVDPEIKPQSVDEFVVGGEYEVFPQTRAGLSYNRRSLNMVIEDMSRDGGLSYFVGNPGYGFAEKFTKPKRNFDAVTFFLQRNFSEGWLAQASYTWSSLRGNFEGLFRSDSGQLDPNINSDFDLISLLPNRNGPLPADRKHQIKVFGSREFNLSREVSLNLGLSYRGNSGTPYSYLGAHELYGPGEAYILPRGSAGRLPWVHRVDSRLAVSWKFTREVAAQVSLDVFNLLDLKTAVTYDQHYTYAAIRPIENGTPADLASLVDVKGRPVAVNQNFGKPLAYQAPRSARLGMRVSF